MFLIYIYIYLAQWYIRQQQYQQAIQLYEKQLPSMTNDNTTTTATTVPPLSSSSIVNPGHYYYLIGEVYHLHLHNVTEANHYYQQALNYGIYNQQIRKFLATNPMFDHHPMDINDMVTNDNVTAVEPLVSSSSTEIAENDTTTMSSTTTTTIDTLIPIPTAPNNDDNGRDTNLTMEINIPNIKWNARWVINSALQSKSVIKLHARRKQLSQQQSAADSLSLSRDLTAMNMNALTSIHDQEVVDSISSLIQSTSTSSLRSATATPTATTQTPRMKTSSTTTNTMKGASHRPAHRQHQHLQD
jgi:tetratricopeptide (TPR) repeat protein